MTTSHSGAYTLRDCEREVATFRIAPGAVALDGNVLRYELVNGKQRATLKISLLVGK